MMIRLATRYAASIGMAGAIASAMLVAFPASAQDSRLSLAERVARLEQQAQNQDKGGIGMVNQMQQLQAQVQQLQGQIEELQHQLQQLDDKNKAQYIDLDSRISRLQGAAAAGTPATAAPTGAPAAKATGNTAASTPASSASSASAPQASAAPAPAGADEQAAYDAAFKALRDGDYAHASRGFRDFIQQHPDSSLAPNAWYWLGESYYVTTNYAVALEAFQRLLSQFPQSDKAPDALLKVGYTQFELKKIDQARATLQDVIRKYPGSKAASLAQERLNRIQLQSAN